MKPSRTLTLRRIVAAMLLAVAGFAAWGHSVDDLLIHVVINDLGHARVVEIRQCFITGQGTEGYIKQYNLGVMDVGEPMVSDETGTIYDVDSPWDVDRSRKAKTNRCGINEVSEGKEICWGLGATGARTYNIRYTLTRLVKSYDDYDGFNFKFYEPAEGAMAQHARVVIERESGEFTPDDTRIWAFRFYGEINLVDGKIVAETEVPFKNSSEGIVILAQFNKGVFHPVTTAKGTFVDKLKKPAFKGSDYTLIEEEPASKSSLKGDGYTASEPSAWAELWDGISGLLQLGLWIVLGLVALIMPFSISSDIGTARQHQRLFGNKQGEMQQWSRDIPFGGDLYKTSDVLHAVRSSDLDENDQIAAVVMRMTHMGLISLATVSNDGTPSANFLVTPPINIPALKDDHQSELIKLIHKEMWEASGSDHILQPKELEAYMKSKPVEHRSVVHQITDLLGGSGRTLSSLQPEEVRQVYGLKKFLQEFTLIEERHVLEVGLWKEYMVFATLYGIAKQVYADLKQIWPDYTMLSPDDSLLVERDLCTTVATYTLGGMSYVRHYETPAERAARLEREREERRSSGGGGSSSYGGGGGYSGGGGSGFR